MMRRFVDRARRRLCRYYNDSIERFELGRGRMLELSRKRAFQRLDYRNIPVVINNYNRAECLQALISWLERAGMRHIIVLDNASTYHGTETLYNKCPHKIICLGHNYGHRALWDSGFYRRVCRSFFVYTDPDVVPTEDCPVDLVRHLFDLLRKYPRIRKAGPGLRIDDLPHSFAHREKVIAWESRFWKETLEPGVFLSPIDTTFALHRPHTTYGAVHPAVRTGAPYVARHLPWYIDSDNPSEEERFYAASVATGASWWTGSAAKASEVISRH